MEWRRRGANGNNMGISQWQVCPKTWSHKRPNLTAMKNKASSSRRAQRQEWRPWKSNQEAQQSSGIHACTKKKKDSKARPPLPGVCLLRHECIHRPTIQTIDCCNLRMVCLTTQGTPCHMRTKTPYTKLKDETFGRSNFGTPKSSWPPWNWDWGDSYSRQLEDTAARAREFSLLILGEECGWPTSSAEWLQN